MPTCIDDFLGSGTSFAILESRLFTLHKPDFYIKPENKISLSDQIYSLEESEEMAALEVECYELNSDLFERYVTKMLKDTIKEGHKQTEDIDNMFSMIQQESVDKNVLHQAMQDYLNIYNRKSKKKVAKKKYNLENNFRLPKLSDLMTISPLIQQLYGKSGVLFFGNNVYNIKRGSARDNYINFKNKKYKIEFRCKSKYFLESYRNIIQNHITNEAKKRNTEIFDIISRIENKRNQMINEVDNLKKSLSKSRIGDIGYKKKGQFYEIFIDIPDFIYKHKENYYLFESTKIAIDVKFSGTSAILIKKPYIPESSMPYNHPFVHSTANICLGNEHFIKGRLEDMNIHFNKIYDLRKHNVSQRIATSLDEAKQVIEDGYMGDVNPVKYLDEHIFRHELLVEGLSDLRAIGVSRERIFPKEAR